MLQLGKLVFNDMVGPPSHPWRHWLNHHAHLNSLEKPCKPLLLPNGFECMSYIEILNHLFSFGAHVFIVSKPALFWTWTLYHLYRWYVLFYSSTHHILPFFSIFGSYNFGYLAWFWSHPMELWELKQYLRLQLHIDNSLSFGRLPWLRSNTLIFR